MTKAEQVLEEVLHYLKENEFESYSVKQLSSALGYEDSKSFNQLVKAIAKAEQEGTILLNREGKFRIKRSDSTIVGIFRSNERGFGFVDYDPTEEDIYVSRDHTGSAMEGDQVEVKIISKPEPWNNKGPEGKVTKVINRKTNRIVGEFFPYDASRREETGYLGYIVPQDNKISHMIQYILPTGIHPVEGSICVTEVVEYPSAENPVSMIGVVTQEIGHKNAPGVDILSILYKLGIPTEFPEDAITQAEEIPFEIPEKEIANRKDLRDEVTITIDGADAKDLDDAISFKILSNGNYELGVHIADVSYYVTENSPIDREAFDRGTSVYLTDRVVPMLPQKLSNGVCSLLPNEDRLAMSCVMEMDHKGEVVRYEIFPSIINSNQRFTYTAVNAILDDRDRKTRDEFIEFVDMLEDMGKLHKTLEKKRKSRGSIDFDTNESKIIVDEEGHPLDIYVVERGVGERLIESFMLAANETVAGHFTRRKLPAIYRIHEQPDPVKMLRFMEFVTTFGIVVTGSNENIKPKQLQQVLKQTENEPYNAVVSSVLLRSMKQAKYDTDPIGHYGLATKDYTHFTSPIRRYPDLIVHRLLRQYLLHEQTDTQREKWENKLPEIAIQSSVTERRSVDAERETESLKKTEFMVDKVGEQFEGVISSVTKFGIFVELPNTVEGLIHISNMKQDYFNYLESHMVLLGERTGIIYRIGQKVRIEVTKADVDSREIDFALVEDDELTVYNQEIQTTGRKKKDKKKSSSKPENALKGSRRKRKDSTKPEQKKTRKRKRR
ncbi:ribonuclease R [Jeotgalibaca ciconiae]|uniref:Ribonuclease R n=1 Tax=Jeotgalibaca ciconiae TaxID=2496265 RepID=A0A3Q9BIM7_9LACT|nr:ribonuclease R [Jeotgalibaca ciconiae]AZP03229.1 ribonuclease R [Jeotgalibaca ciconiae]